MFDELVNLVQSLTRKEDNAFSFNFDPQMLQIDPLVQESFSKILGHALLIKSAVITINHENSYITVEGIHESDVFHGTAVRILADFFLDNGDLRYHCIVLLPPEWVHEYVQAVEQLLNNLQAISAVRFDLHEPGLAISTIGPLHGPLQQLTNITENIQGFNLIARIELSGEMINTINKLLGLPNTLKFNVGYHAGDPVPMARAIYDEPLSVGILHLDYLMITMAPSQFELSFPLRFQIGEDTILFSAFFSFVNASSFELGMRFSGVQTRNNGIAQEWVNPLGLNWITISGLGGKYRTEPAGFSVIMEGIIKLGEEQKDQMVINVLLELLNGSMPVSFVGKLSHSDESEIPLSRLINSFFQVIIMHWPDDGRIDHFAPWLDDPKVKYFELYFIPGPEPIISPMDPSVTFSPGLGLSAQGSYFGNSALFHVIAESKNSQNLLIRANMDIIDLGDGMVRIEAPPMTVRGHPSILRKMKP
ncbi:hypothetical protein V3851_10450 [Paenibacillus sp. M1]|uniref:Uncharacterized protein n=1 Tax=Paenibacillus haidiansis TaxID=1574488 RepID=A0ABU7VR90_9BACL